MIIITAVVMKLLLAEFKFMSFSGYNNRLFINGKPFERTNYSIGCGWNSER